jgi:hypothetical protein
MVCGGGRAGARGAQNKYLLYMLGYVKDIQKTIDNFKDKYVEDLFSATKSELDNNIVQQDTLQFTRNLLIKYNYFETISDEFFNKIEEKMSQVQEGLNTDGGGEGGSGEGGDEELRNPTQIGGNNFMSPMPPQMNSMMDGASSALTKTVQDGLKCICEDYLKEKKYEIKEMLDEKFKLIDNEFIEKLINKLKQQIKEEPTSLEQVKTDIYGGSKKIKKRTFRNKPIITYNRHYLSRRAARVPSKRLTFRRGRARARARARYAKRFSIRSKISSP